MIRKELGLTQSQLAFPGMTKSIIAKIESGERELNPKQAALLAARFQELGCTVSAKVLMGQDKDVAGVLKTLESGIDEAKLNEIDDVILKLDNDKAVELILGIIEILKISVDSYARYILKYILKLNEFNISKEIYIKINIDLMGIYFILNDFGNVIIVASAVKVYLSGFSKHDSFKYYYNLANAHYYLKEYTKAKRYLEISKKFGKDKYKLNILDLESSILTMKKKFMQAIAINKEIISIATELKLYEYISNSNSNISFILVEQGKIQEAQKYMEEAMKYINNIDDFGKLNVINNKFYLENVTNSATISSFKTLILLSIKINDKVRRNDSIELFINKSIENNSNINVFFEVFNFLKANNIVVDANLKLKVVQHIYKRHSSECDFESFLDEMINF